MLSLRERGHLGVFPVPRPHPVGVSADAAIGRRQGCTLGSSLPGACTQVGPLFPCPFSWQTSAGLGLGMWPRREGEGDPAPVSAGTRARLSPEGRSCRWGLGWAGTCEARC